MLSIHCSKVAATSFVPLTQLNLLFEEVGCRFQQEGEKKNESEDMRNLLIPLHCSSQSFCYSLLPDRQRCAFFPGLCSELLSSCRLFTLNKPGYSCSLHDVSGRVCSPVKIRCSTPTINSPLCLSGLLSQACGIKFVSEAA